MGNLSQTQTLETSFHLTDPDTLKTDTRFKSRVWFHSEALLPRESIK